MGLPSSRNRAAGRLGGGEDPMEFRISVPLEVTDGNV